MLVVKYINRAGCTFRWQQHVEGVISPKNSEHRVSVKTKQNFSFWIIHTSFPCWEGHLRNKVRSQEKAYLILPSDLQTICSISKQTMKVMRRKIALWVQEHVSGFPGWRWNMGWPDHLQRNTGTRLSEGHRVGLIRSRGAAGFWHLLAQMMLTALSFILIPVMFGGAFTLRLTEVMSRNLNWTIKHNRTTESCMPLADYFLFIKMFCKIKGILSSSY